MRQRLNMSPVTSSVPVGSARQDDILTRDRQPRVPRGKFTTSANKDVHTHTAVCTCTLRAYLNCLDVMPTMLFPCIAASHIICQVMVLMTPNPLVGRSLESGDRSAQSSSHCVPVHRWWETEQEEIQHVVGISSHSWIYTHEFLKYSSRE